MSEERLDKVLFGTDPTEKIVAVETSDKDATLFLRDGEETKTKIVPFVPWLVTDKERHFPGAETTALQGDGYNWRVRRKPGHQPRRTIRAVFRRPQELLLYSAF